MYQKATYRVKPVKLEDPSIIDQAYRIIPHGNCFYAGRQVALISGDNLVHRRYWMRVSRDYSRKGNVARLIQKKVKEAVV